MMISIFIKCLIEVESFSIGVQSEMYTENHMHSKTFFRYTLHSVSDNEVTFFKL